MNADKIEDVEQSTRDGIAFAVREALKKERVEIARLLATEADKHIHACDELSRDYDDEDASIEAWNHAKDARLLHDWADRIRARTPAEPVTDEIAF